VRSRRHARRWRRRLPLVEGGAWERRELFPLLRKRLGIADALDDVAVRFMREYTSWFRWSLDGAWMIGDSDADIEAAHAAGVDSVWLHHGRSWTVDDHAPTVVADAFVDGVAAFLRAASASPTGEPS
jgi:phosphoglycolate phosphatase-like HAD superfamily hydrolase